jgi:hypothetical protein
MTGVYPAMNDKNKHARAAAMPVTHENARKFAPVRRYQTDIFKTKKQIFMGGPSIR